MMHLRLTRKPAHPTQALQTATNGLFFAVLSGQKTPDPLPLLTTDETDSARDPILGKPYLPHRD